MKIKNKPSSEFFTEMYDEVEALLKSLDIFHGVNITVNNIIGDAEFLKPTKVITGRVVLENGGENNKDCINYTITLAELQTLKFGNPEWDKLYNVRYNEFINSLGLQFSSEAMTILTFLHEIGHIEYWEIFQGYTETKCDGQSLKAYAKMMNGMYEYVIKPWEFSNKVDSNMANTLFNPIECYPHLFALQHFPRFIKLLKKHGLELSD
jgi:hypothetical protein